MAQAEIGRRVGLGPTAVLDRIRRLTETGVIRGFRAVLEPESLGFGLTAFAQVSLTLHQEKPIERFRRAVRKLPEVQECHNVSGEFDFWIKVVCKDMKHYERFVREQLSTIAGIERIHSIFVLATNKDVDRLPLGDLPNVPDPA